MLLTVIGCIVVGTRQIYADKYGCFEYFKRDDERPWLLDVRTGESIQTYAGRRVTANYQLTSTNPQYTLSFWQWQEHGFPYSKIEADTNTRKHREIGFAMKEIILLNRSADNLYLAIRNVDEQKISILALPDLSIVESYSPIIYNISWAPQGHRFAAFDQQGYLTIHSLSDHRVEHISLHDPKQPNWSLFPTSLAISWSPDGRYLSLSGYKRRPRHLSVDLYDRIIDLQDFQSWYAARDQGGEFTSFPSTWALNSKGWLYVDRELDSGASRRQLKLLHLDTGERQLVADDVTFNSALSGDRRYLAVSTAQGSKHSIDVYDVNSMRLWTLFSGADEIVSEPVWISDRQIVAAWSTGNEASTYALHLTWMNADGTNRDQVESQLLYAGNFQLLPNFGIIYLAESLPVVNQSRYRQVMLTNFKTSKSSVLGETTLDNNLYVALSPDNKTFIVFYDKLHLPYGSRGLLFIGADGTTKASFQDFEQGSLTWSPDSTAFVSMDGNNQVQVISSNGTVLFNGYIASLFGSSVTWTHCD